MKKQSKLPAPKIWSQSKTDIQISLWVRARDKKCMFPACQETEKLQCSHYHGRARNSTRYHPDNLIALCRRHHYGDKLIGWEYAKQRKEIHGRDGAYTVFMKRWLGPKKFKELDDLSKVSMKGSTAIIQAMELLGKL